MKFNSSPYSFPLIGNDGNLQRLLKMNSPHVFLSCSPLDDLNLIIEMFFPYCSSLTITSKFVNALFPIAKNGIVVHCGHDYAMICAVYDSKPLLTCNLFKFTQMSGKMLTKEVEDYVGRLGKIEYMDMDGNILHIDNIKESGLDFPWNKIKIKMIEDCERKLEETHFFLPALKG